MFTGIVKGLCQIVHIQHHPGMLKYAVALTKDLLKGLELGASLSVNGVCQTVIKIEGNHVWFDAIQDTLNRTTLAYLASNDQVNIERSAKFGDEIGGHVLSGHVYGTGKIEKVEKAPNNVSMSIQVPQEWMKYFFCKGFIALDGVSLTLGNINREKGYFLIHLIPETLRLTTFGKKKEGDLVNVELDSQTQTIVETVERISQRNTDFS